MNKARAVMAVPEKPRFDAKTVDELQGTSLTKHQGKKMETHSNEKDSMKMRATGRKNFTMHRNGTKRPMK